ncbi:uncharacterized protein LOC118510909 isoform X1 [Anopheles stephensi]|uniref:uncharacterized protein LOC118510909 isoform X1 n=1 Tax=Anopheles stephensi TaxID=30069 RepID=UPI0016589CCC|nr:uncharacterized protein LOC118510909 isoform X1 [Anopheles stephensi]XP_035909193.1 uncharacterized protein LOC118510909 isoform X1 [Anopheles stephensi]XP_035909194.1 uncharacterized protein LOC118510909 isoform X1 [Anopheles stephensi]XP_035909195.1 uncharacterized protein LOC118510909 isoform X1 [Anopheles stephensi]
MTHRRPSHRAWPNRPCWPPSRRRSVKSHAALLPSDVRAAPDNRPGRPTPVPCRPASTVKPCSRLIVVRFSDGTGRATTFGLHGHRRPAKRTDVTDRRPEMRIKIIAPFADRINRPEVKLSPINVATTVTATHPTYRAVNPTTFPPAGETVPRPVLQSTVDPTGGDNDVTGLKHPRTLATPDSCIVPDERCESLRNVFHVPDVRTTDRPVPATEQTLHQSSNGVDVDYFKTNFTDDKTPDVNANRAHSFDEEPNKYDTQTPQDKSIDPDRFGAAAENSAPVPVRHTEDNNRRAVQPRMISFTDGEFIFGPFDERALEFGRFELLSDKLGARNQPPAGTGTMATTTTMMTAAADERPHRAFLSDGAKITGRTGPPDECLRRNATLSPGQREDETIQVENSAVPGDDKWKIATPAPKSDDDDDRQQTSPYCDDYTRWARFENGNISPPPSENELTADGNRKQSADSPAQKRRTRGEEIEDIFQQLNQSLKANAATVAVEADGTESAAKATLGQLVENVPVIERILDDLLTFSKQLLEQKHYLEAKESIDDANEDAVTKLPPANRGTAQLAEINDDNLINLLGNGNEAVDAGEAVDQRDNPGESSPYKSHNAEPDVSDASETPGVSIVPENEKLANNDSNNSNQAGDFVSGLTPNGSDERAQQEDLFTNVAIFNWNPLDVYQQHGLFMIDPRFALADMRAISPVPTTTPLQPFLKPLPTVPEEMDTAVANDHAIDAHRAQVPGVSIDNQSAKNYTTKANSPCGRNDASGASTLHDSPSATPKTAGPDWKMDACHNYCSPSVDPTVTAGSSARTGRLSSDR